MNTDVQIDGSRGEGGGQIVRTSLSLSAVLGRSVKVEKIRNGRTTPGLQAQHMTGARLVAEIASAPIHGANKGSSSFVLEKTTSEEPDHELPLQSIVQTAGATSLVLQAALPPALRFLPSVNVDDTADRCTLSLGGGTTALFAPTSDYVHHVLAPNLRHFGVQLSFDVVRHGFFPRGGGLCLVTIDKYNCEAVALPGQEETVHCKLLPCQLTERGTVDRIQGRVLVSGANYISNGLGEICRQKARQVIRKYVRGVSGYPDISEDDISVSNLTDAEGTGECVAITLFAKTSAGTVLGASAIWSERDAVKKANATRSSLPNRHDRSARVQFWQSTVADSAEAAAEELCEVMQSQAVVDSHMADQFVVFMALAGGTSRLLVPKPTLHLTSVISVMQSFGVCSRLEPIDGSENHMLICDGEGVLLRK